MLNYKGYKAIDLNTGQELEIQNGNSGRIKLSIPASFSGDIFISWHSPWYWRVAEVLTLVALVGLAVYAIPRKSNKNML